MGDPHISTSAGEDATLEVSYQKALLCSALCMVVFAVALTALGLPWGDPLFFGFFSMMIVGMPFVFAAGICFSLRCKIGYEGLYPAVPGLYRDLLRWEEITVVRGFASPFYIVRGSVFGPFCILPRRFLLKDPDSLKRLLEQHAPAGNIVRRRLAA